MAFNDAYRKITTNVYVGGELVKAKSFKYSNSVNDNQDRLLPGTTACATVTATVFKEYTEDLTNKTLEIFLNAGLSGDGAWLGEYYITDFECVAGSGVTTIRATDLMGELDGIDYISSLDYPAYAYQMLQEIQSLTGVYFSYNEPGTDIGYMPTIKIDEAPKGYTCREIVSYIAGLYGMFAIDTVQLYPFATIAYRNNIVFMDYVDSGYTIPASMIYQNGLQLKTQYALRKTPLAYVESQVVTVVTEDTEIDGIYPAGDIHYLQSPDSLSAQSFYKPYWFIVYGHPYDPDLSTAWYIYFFDTQPTFKWSTGDYESLNQLYFTAEVDEYGKTWAYSGEFEWNLAGIDTGVENGLFEIYCGANTSTEALNIVASNFNIYLDDGTLLQVANRGEVGLLREENIDKTMDIRYLQNPDDYADAEEYKPYWIIFYDNVRSNYQVFFFDSPPLFYYNRGMVQMFYLYADVDEYGQAVTTWSRANSNVISTENWSEWVEASFTLYNDDRFNYYIGRGSTESDFSPVAANFEAYLNDGSLFQKNNGDTVGSKRNGGSTTRTEVYFGTGDYTNPLISSDNVEAVQAHQKAHNYFPGELKWRGDPAITVGSKVTITDRNGNNIPFLFSSVELSYDGGLVAVCECHGSEDNFNKDSALQKNLKKIRKLKAEWTAKQEVTSS